ncbi:histone-like nucleoid-structuring protein Lsr2 [Streptomyces sp. NPDC048717]|uniref:Lsr2 family DNA-binding protein n=1 Tax=Streptomyces sp. NPDC048717 TaxID=3154928 RepID=UPI00341B2AE1
MSDQEQLLPSVDGFPPRNSGPGSPRARETSSVPAHRVEREDVRQAWGRITGWLQRHAPDALSGLGGPGNAAAIDEAGTRLGLKPPAELREWLLAIDADARQLPLTHSHLGELGAPGLLPDGEVLLGLTGIERVYLHMVNTAERAPSGDPDHPFWRREWIPISAEADGFHWRFLDTRTGSLGSWAEGSSPVENTYPSLSAFFHDVADQLAGIRYDGASGGARPGSPGRRRTDEGTDERTEAIRRWARAQGYLINDRGRVPSAIRESYEASQ